MISEIGLDLYILTSAIELRFIKNIPPDDWNYVSSHLNLKGNATRDASSDILLAIAGVSFKTVSQECGMVLMFEIFIKFSTWKGMFKLIVILKHNCLALYGLET